MDVFEPVRAWPTELRPRERLLQAGAGVLSDGDLLAVLLRTGATRCTAVDLARRLLTAHGDLAGLARVEPAGLAATHGVGPGKAAALAAAFELGRRCYAARTPSQPLTTPDAVYRHVVARFLGSGRESLWILGLDTRNLPIVDALVGAGTVDRAPAHAREIFGPLLRAGAAKGILAHNHPSGDPEPSAADMQLTRRMRDAGELIGIPLVDHLIVGDGCFVSLHARGLLA